MPKNYNPGPSDCMFTLPLKSFSSHCDCALEELEVVEKNSVHFWFLAAWLSMLARGVQCSSAGVEPAFHKLFRRRRLHSGRDEFL